MLHYSFPAFNKDFTMAVVTLWPWSCLLLHQSNIKYWAITALLPPPAPEPNTAQGSLPHPTPHEAPQWLPPSLTLPSPEFGRGLLRKCANHTQPFSVCYLLSRNCSSTSQIQRNSKEAGGLVRRTWLESGSLDVNSRLGPFLVVQA